MEIKEAKKKGRFLKPILNIGKNGITDPVITEIKKHLKQKRLIKIKFLRSFIQKTGKKEAAETLAKKTDSRLIELKGFTLLLQKIEKNK